MKRSIILYLILCFITPITINADKKPFGGGLYWELSNDGTLTISGNGEMPNTYVPWYNKKGIIRTIVIEHGVSTIMDMAFSDCKSLTSVTLPNSMKSIGKNAFWECTSLTFVKIPNSVTSIGSSAFFECSNLQSVEISGSVTSIEEYTFFGCTKLSYVTIPNSVTSIGALAFCKCKNLTSVTIPNSVTSIGNSAFQGTGLTSIIIPNSVTSIGEGAFALCSGLASVNLSNSVTSIGEKAFVYCNGLTSINIPNTVTSIGDAAFGYSPYYRGNIVSMPQWLINKGLKEWERCGLSEESVNAYQTGKKLYSPTIIKAEGGYTSAVELNNGSTKYWKVSKGGRYGLTDAEGKVIVPTEMEALESAGAGYLRYKLNGFWGLMDYTGRIIIDTDRGYTSIGDFKTFNKRFPYTMTGYKGECDINGRQISKIKVETPPQQPVVVSNTPSTVASFYSNDLKTYDLRGKVKKCTWKGNYVDADYLPIIKYSNGESISNFTLDGTLQIKNFEIIRDSSGRITKLQSDMSLYYELSYDEKGKLVKLKRALPQLERLADYYYYSYDSSDRIIAITHKSFGEDSDKPSFRFEYTQSDSNGNWIKRIAKSQLGNVTQTREIEYY